MIKPLRVSWSAIRTYEECHAKSALIRDGKRAKVSNIRNFWPGTVVDQAMRVWLDSPQPRPAMADLIAEVMDSSQAQEKEKGNVVRFRDAGDRDFVRSFCTDLVNRLEPLLEEHVLPYPYEHGKWFKVPLTIPGLDGQPRDILLTGEMDLLVDNDGPVVWDLKGTADDQYYRKVVAQLTFYDLAVWASSGVKTRFAGLIQPMCTERVMAWVITDEARAQLLTRIERYAHGVWADERTCTDKTGTCHWCDVKHACPRYSQPSADVFGDLAAGLRTAAGEPT
jgi:hypothetical protein